MRGRALTRQTEMHLRVLGSLWGQLRMYNFESDSERRMAGSLASLIRPEGGRARLLSLRSRRFAYPEIASPTMKARNSNASNVPIM
jgi:hypothetical protein